MTDQQQQQPQVPQFQVVQQQPMQSQQQPPQPQVPQFQVVQQQPMQSQQQPPQRPQPPTPASAYEQIIEQQRQQIEAMQAQNLALNAQVVSMVNNGAQFQQQPQQQQQQQTPQYAQPAQQTIYPNVYEPYNPPISLTENIDYSMEGLAKEIGKKGE